MTQNFAKIQLVLLYFWRFVRFLALFLSQNIIKLTDAFRQWLFSFIKTSRREYTNTQIHNDNKENGKQTNGDKEKERESESQRANII